MREGTRVKYTKKDNKSFYGRLGIVIDTNGSHSNNIMFDDAVSAHNRVSKEWCCFEDEFEELNTLNPIYNIKKHKLVRVRIY